MMLPGGTGVIASESEAIQLKPRYEVDCFVAALLVTTRNQFRESRAGPERALSVRHRCSPFAVRRSLFAVRFRNGLDAARSGAA